MKTQRWLLVLTIVCAGLVSGLGMVGRADAQYQQRDQQRGYRWRRSEYYSYRTVTIPAGSRVSVRLNTPISTDDSNVGDTWTGVTQNDIVARGVVAIPAGTQVTGTVTQVQPARHDQRAVIDLAMDAVDLNGQRVDMHGSTPAVIAGSSRARNLGITAGGAVAGALLGHAISHKHGTLIGGVLGGLGGYAYTRGHSANMKIKEGTTLDFVIDNPVSVRS